MKELSTWLEKQGEQKPAWSEEDEKIMNDLLWIIEAYRKNGFNKTHTHMANISENWLKSLKDRIQLKQEE